MQTYDILMILVLITATMFGFYKGMAWQIASVASLVVSYLVALKFAPQLAPYFGDSAPWNKFVAMLAIYVASSAVIWSAFRIVSGAIDRVKLKEFDHQMGAMIGLAKGVLWCIAITFFAVTLLPDQQKEQILGSQAGHYIVVLLDKTDSMVPPEVHDVIHPYLHRINERLDPNYKHEHEDLQDLWPGDLPQVSFPSGSSTWPQEPNAQTPADSNAWPPTESPGSSAWPTEPNPFPGP